MKADSPLPLSGIVVADFSRILAGPLATQLLSDGGARVIKVEEAGRGDETRRWGPPFVEQESAYFLALNRNKESVTLNLKTEEGRAIARRLIERADVVVQNFLPRQQSEFGLTAEQVHAMNARAVHCSIRGYDRESAEANLPGYDLLAQAGAGLMAITGPSDGEPTKAGVALADVLTAHYAHGAIVSALFERERKGRARAIEVSLFGAAAASMVNVAQNYLVTGCEPQRYGNEHPSIVPYQSFAARDRAFVVAVATDRHFELLCRDVLRRTELVDDPRFRTNAERVAHRQELVPLLARSFITEGADVWVTRCRAVGIPASKVQNFREIFDGSASSLVDRVEHATIGELSIVGTPVRLDGERSHTRSAPPVLGASTDAVLGELGYTPAEIERFRRDGVI